MTKTLLAGAVSALALVAAGCGGSDNSSSSSATPTDEWATGFCTAITSWTDSIKTTTSDLADPSSLSKDGLQGATDDFVDNVKGLGAPDTASGQEIKSSIDELATTLDTESSDIQSTVQGVSGLTSLPGALTSITTALKAMGTAFSSTLTTIQNNDAKGELQSALQDSPACANISG
jgi:hypothetical protein